MELHRQGTIGRSKASGITQSSPIIIELQNKLMQFENALTELGLIHKDIQED